MTEHHLLIQTKLQHLARMREYLAYSLSQVEKLLPLDNWAALARLAEFFALLAKETTALFGYFSRLNDFCVGVYGTGGD